MALEFSRAESATRGSSIILFYSDGPFFVDGTHEKYADIVILIEASADEDAVRRLTHPDESADNGDSIDRLASILAVAGEVDVDFVYRRGTGAEIQVSTTIVRLVDHANGETILVADPEGDGTLTHYRSSFVSDLVIDEGVVADVLGSDETDEYEEDVLDTEDDIDAEGDALIADLIRQADARDAAGVTTVVGDTTQDAFQTVRDAVRNGDAVAVNFNYTTAEGEPRHVVNFPVEEVVATTGANVYLFVGRRTEDDAVRSYRTDRIQNLVVVGNQAPQAQDATLNTGVVADAAVDTDVEQVLRDAVENGDDIVINFNYTTVDGEPRTLTDFKPSAIRPTATPGIDLLIGIRSEDNEQRTYRLDRVTDLEIVEGDQTAAAAEPEVHDTLLAALDQDGPVFVTFSYTSAQGNVRTVRNAEVSDVVYSRNHAGKYLLLARRERDSEDKQYRTDRIENLVFNQAD
jgi:predicted DNA-binding transcriptional regulator YafY